MNKLLGWVVWIGTTAIVTTVVLVVVRQIGPLQRLAGLNKAGSLLEEARFRNAAEG